jgi:hypothetical protein
MQLTKKLENQLDAAKKTAEATVHNLKSEMQQISSETQAMLSEKNAAITEKAAAFAQRDKALKEAKDKKKLWELDQETVKQQRIKIAGVGFINAFLRNLILRDKTAQLAKPILQYLQRKHRVNWDGNLFRGYSTLGGFICHFPSLQENRAIGARRARSQR